jgi:hypothetical protein
LLPVFSPRPSVQAPGLVQVVLMLHLRQEQVLVLGLEAPAWAQVLPPTQLQLAESTPQLVLVLVEHYLPLMSVWWQAPPVPQRWSALVVRLLGMEQVPDLAMNREDHSQVRQPPVRTTHTVSRQQPHSEACRLLTNE